MGTKIYMQFGSIKSTTTDSNHKDWVELQSCHYCVTRPVTQSSGSSNRTIGTANVSSLLVKKRMNLATQDIFKEAHGGSGASDCTIHFVGDKGTYMEYRDSQRSG